MLSRRFNLLLDQFFKWAHFLAPVFKRLGKDSLRIVTKVRQRRTINLNVPKRT